MGKPGGDMPRLNGVSVASVHNLELRAAVGRDHHWEDHKNRLWATLHALDLWSFEPRWCPAVS